MYPHERSLVEEHKDRPFVMLGVSLDQTPQILASVIRKESFTWPIIFDRGVEERNPIAEQWEVIVIPTTYVIDHEGMIRYKHVRNGKLDRAINKLLREID
jgi:peroxiredoxin